MPLAVLIIGAIGEGKTRACLELAERCRRGGFRVCGLVSPRVIINGRLLGYNCLDLSSREEFPLARLGGMVEGPDWFSFGGLRYAFSTSGFGRANSILFRSSESMNPSTIIFIDEFGRLEAAGGGLLPGIMRVVERLRGGGSAVFTCRDELQNPLRRVIGDEGVELLLHRPSGLEEIWMTIQRFLTLPR